MDSISVAATVAEIILYRFVYAKREVRLGHGEINSLSWRTPGNLLEVCYYQFVSTI